MSREIGPKKRILSTTANLAAANSTWFSLEGCDKVEIQVAIIGNGTASIDFDLYNKNGNAATYTSNFTSNNISVMDDPMGAIRGWADNMSANESITIDIRKVYLNKR